MQQQWLELIEIFAFLGLGVGIVLVIRRLLGVSPLDEAPPPPPPEGWETGEKPTPDRLRPGDVVLRRDGLRMTFLRKADPGEYAEEEEWLFKPLEDGEEVDLHIGVKADGFDELRRLKN